MAVTLRDVAVRAGVSVRTVSNVVNGFQHVSPPMRERVQKALDELGYQPNVLARSLRRGHTGVIALLVPELSVPYFGELAHEVIESARSRGWTVMVDETGGVAEREREILELATTSGLVDGVVLSALGLVSAELAELKPRVPLVLLGERTAPGVFDHAGTDNVGAAKDAVAHLFAGGATRVAAIGAEPGTGRETSRLRLRGYRAALKTAGQPADASLVPPVSSFHRQDGAQAMQSLLALAAPTRRNLLLQRQPRPRRAPRPVRPRDPAAHRHAPRGVRRCRGGQVQHAHADHHRSGQAGHRRRCHIAAC